MKQVTKNEFFSIVEKYTAHPKTGPERSVWRDQITGEIIGYTYPGYLVRNVLGKYDAETKYFIEAGQ